MTRLDSKRQNPEVWQSFVEFAGSHNINLACEEKHHLNDQPGEPWGPWWDCFMSGVVHAMSRL